MCVARANMLPLSRGGFDEEHSGAGPNMSKIFGLQNNDEKI